MFFLFKRIFLCISLIFITTKAFSQPSKTKVDINLSTYNTTMLYATLADIDFNYERYENKTICIKGAFFIFDDYSSSQNAIFGCFIPDKTGCCLKGLGFYPKEEFYNLIKNNNITVYDEIIVTGIFKTYDNQGNLFKGLIDASIEKANSY